MSEQAERTPWLWISEGETRISDRYGYVTLVTDLNGQPAVYFDGDAMRELTEAARQAKTRIEAEGRVLKERDVYDALRAALAKVKGES